MSQIPWGSLRLYHFHKIIGNLDGTIIKCRIITNWGVKVDVSGICEALSYDIGQQGMDMHKITAAPLEEI